MSEVRQAGKRAMRGLRPSGAGRPRFTKTLTPAPEGRVMQIVMQIALRVRVARTFLKP